MESELFEKFHEDGFCIVKCNAHIMDELNKLFELEYKSKFTEDTKINRNLLKCFASEPLVRQLFFKGKLFDALADIGISHPLYTGPVVTHYTSLDLTGGAYGLKMHQDWPSMATSNNGVISWISMFDTDDSTHGITIAPGSHKHGALPGRQTDDSGYLVDTKFIRKSINLKIEKGSYLLMHPWLAHATYVNDKCSKTEYKLSISARFDDFNCQAWALRGFRNAYTVTVDREMWSLQ